MQIIILFSFKPEICWLKFCSLSLIILETKTLCNCQNKGLAALCPDGIASRLVAFSVYRPGCNPLQLFGWMHLLLNSTLSSSSVRSMGLNSLHCFIQQHCRCFKILRNKARSLYESCWEHRFAWSVLLLAYLCLWLRTKCKKKALIVSQPPNHIYKSQPTIIIVVIFTKRVLFFNI